MEVKVLTKSSQLNRVVVGISEMEISNRPEDVLVTYSLGSCIGVAIYDPGLTANVLNMADLAFTAGLLHDIGKLVLSTFVDDGFNAI